MGPKPAPSGRDSKVSVNQQQGQSPGNQTTTSPRSGSEEQGAATTKTSLEKVDNDQTNQHQRSVAEVMTETQLFDADFGSEWSEIYRKFLEMCEPLGY